MSNQSANSCHQTGTSDLTTYEVHWRLSKNFDTFPDNIATNH